MKNIPMVTFCKAGKDGPTTFKKPMYELVSAEVEMAKQKRLGKMLSFWYGTNCKKCCGCFPKFFEEQSFGGLGYYVCLVCGRESKHEPMLWIARDEWNKGNYSWTPEPGIDQQLTIFDF